MDRPSKLLLVVVWVLAASGCQSGPRPATPIRIGYCLPSAEALNAVHRVVFVALSAPDGEYPEIAQSLTESTFAALQAKRLFHVDVLRADDPTCQDLPLQNREPFTIQQLGAMRTALKCDAVLLGSINQFHPHPRMQVGLYLRLLDLKNGRLLWGVDHVWDSTDKTTENRIQDFFERRMRPGYDPVDWRLALMSPRTFSKFVAYEIASTLPQTTPEPTPSVLDSVRENLYDFRKN